MKIIKHYGYANYFDPHSFNNVLHERDMSIKLIFINLNFLKYIGAGFPG